jgi:CRP-like cAMP-binding protein
VSEIASERQIDKVALLREVELFAGLPTATLESLAKLARIAVYPAGDEIIEEGAEFDDEADGILLIIDGAVEVRKDSTDGSDGTLLMKLGQGDFFGEMALLDGGPRTATVTATTDITLYALTEWVFRGLLAEHPGIAMRTLETMASRLRGATKAASA